MSLALFLGLNLGPVITSCIRDDNAANNADSLKLVFTVAPTSLTQSEPSAIYTVQRQNGNNQAISSGSTTANLSQDGNAEFYSDAFCTNPITSVTIDEPFSSASFYLKDSLVESITITAATSGFTSAEAEVDVLQTIDDFVSDLTFPSKDSDNFSEPSIANLSIFYNLVSKIMEGTYSGHSSDLVDVGYRIIYLTDDTIGTKAVVALKEIGSTGGGTYLLHIEPAKDLTIEAPHPVYDINTLEETSYLFQKLKARAFFIAGTHRCNSPTGNNSSCSGTTSACGSSEAYRISDVAHNTSTYFHEAHKAAYDFNDTNVIIQVHGKSDSQGSPAVAIFFNGISTDDVGSKSNILADALESALVAEVYSCNKNGDPNTLFGTTNVQGRYSNDSPDPCSSAASSASERFFHLEQNRSIRDSISDWGHVENVLNSNF